MTTIPYSEAQALSQSAKVELFVVDATACGAGVYYLVSNVTTSGQSVSWQGQAYQPIPLEAEGFEANTKGTLPRPKLRTSNLNGVIGALVRDYQDLVGAKVIRKVTFAKYLDGQPGANPDIHFPDQIWIINQKTIEDASQIEFELMAPIDAQGLRVPRRIIQATSCVWSAETIEVCPYVGACPKTLAACNGYYPSGDLPFGGEPGARRTS